MEARKTDTVDVSTIPLRELPVDNHWRENVLAEMGRRKLTQKQLNLAIGAGDNNAQISYLVGEGKLSGRSKWVERISAYLGIDLPLVAQLEIAGRTLADGNDIDGLKAATLTATALAEHSLAVRNSK